MRAIFLDRDGVINTNRDDHVKSWDEFEFIPGALTALRQLYLAGFSVFVITNQAVVGRGQVSCRIIDDIHARMMQQILLHGGKIQDLRYCPHAPHENCCCRKPKPGMLQQLASAWKIDTSSTYLVGDALTDIAAGQAVGCTSILVRTGRGAEQAQLPEAKAHPADYIATDLLQAVCWLIEREGLALSHHEVTHLPRRTVADPVPLLVPGR